MPKCNRTACQREGADWWNRVMHAWYCTRCALLINEGQRMYGQPELCERVPACPPAPAPTGSEGSGNG